MRAPAAGGSPGLRHGELQADFIKGVLGNMIPDITEGFDLAKDQVVCDPFCGTGTTLIEARLAGFKSVGLEPVPVSHFASTVKLNLDVDPDELRADAARVAEHTREALQAQEIWDDWDCSAKAEGVNLRGLDPKRKKLLIKNSISPLALHKTLVLLDELREEVVVLKWNGQGNSGVR